MDADREKKVTEIKELIRRGKYRVDPKAVADAIVRRLAAMAAAEAAGLAPAGLAPRELRTSARNPRAARSRP